MNTVVKKLLNNLKKHKKVSIIIFIILILVVVITIILLNRPAKKEMTQEEQLTQYLEELGKEFYENFYYQQIGQDDEARKKFLAKLTENGIKVNLDSLSRYNEDENKEKLDAFVNKETGKSCHKENTKITIYPKEPYEKTDYTFEISLDCGFNNE